MSIADRAREIWRQASAAAHSLAACEMENPSILLGRGLSDELMRELAHVSGGTFERYRAADEDSSLIKVWSYLNATAAGLTVYAVKSRPATSADESIPLRGGRA
jgi:ABC-type cobalamin transport system ATPase subunit